MKMKNLLLERLEARLNLSSLAGASVLQAPALTDVTRLSGLTERFSSTNRIKLSTNFVSDASAMSSAEAVAQSVASDPFSSLLLGDTTVSGATGVSVSSYSAINSCQLETRNGTQNIGYMSPGGAWVEYRLNVTSPGTYKIDLALSSPNGATGSVAVNGTATNFTLSRTGSWDSYTNVSTNVTLGSGVQTLRVAARDASQFNIRGLNLTPVNSSVATPTPTGGTTTITSNTQVNVASYSSIYNSRLETRNGSTNIGYVSTSGAYVEYTLNVQSAGNYDIALNTAQVGNSSLDLLVNGSRAASYSLAATGSWDAYRATTKTVTLPAGTVKLRLAATNGTQYNIRGIGLVKTTASTTPTPTPSPAPAPTPAPSTATGTVTVQTQWLTSFNQLNITGTSGNDSIYVSQSGSTITVNANGRSQNLSGNWGAISVKGLDGADTITIDSSVSIETLAYGGRGNDTIKNYTRGKATIVAVGGGQDWLQGNGSNTSFWADGSDSVNASSAEINAGRVHAVNSFAYGVSLELDGQNLKDPSDTGTPVRLQSNSLWGTGPRMEDVKQGQVANCYALAAPQSLAYSQPDRLREVAVDLGDGTYAVHFKRGGTNTFVRVDGELAGGGPYAGGLRFAQPTASGNMWMPILEKAYAQFRSGANSYASLAYGWYGAVLADLGIAYSTKTPGSTAASTLYTSITNAINSKRGVVTGTKDSVSGAPVIGNHVYTIVKATKDAVGNMFVTLRNPWGFDGAGNDGNANDAQVTISMSQFQSNFSSMAIVS